MVVDQILTDVTVWAIAFALGSIVSWLVWLTVRHYRFAKPAYDALAGTDLDEGHLEQTGARFEQLESAHEDMRARVDKIERKVDQVSEKSDRNYRLLQRLAEKVGVDGVFFRGGGSSPSDDD